MFRYVLVTSLIHKTFFVNKNKSYLKVDFRDLSWWRPFWILGSRKFSRNFPEGAGGQISSKMSQEPKTSEKKS